MMLLAARSFGRVLKQFGLSAKVVGALILLQLTTIALEFAAVLMLLPVFEHLKAGGDVSQLNGKHWEVLRSVADFTGIPLTLGVLLIVSFVLLLMRQVASYLNIYAGEKVLLQSVNRVRRKLFAGYIFATSARQQSQRTGEFANDLTVELDRAIHAVFRVLRIVGLTLQICTYAVGLLLLSVQMTIYVAVVVLAIVAIGTRFLGGIRSTAKAISSANTELSAFLIDRLQRARLIRLSGTERAEVAGLAKLSEEQTSQTFRQKMLATRMTLLPEPIAIAVGYSVVYVGGQILGLPLDRLALFVIMLVRMMPIVKGVIDMINGTLGSWASVDRIVGQLSTLSKARETRGGSRVFENLQEQIEYRNVSFRYEDSSQSALHEVTVALPARKMTALIGPSGAGKSTFIDLLPRLREPDSGQIEFDGVPITEFSIDSLRAGIAFVAQQPQILNVTVGEYMGYGAASDVGLQQLRQAAKLAGALEFIERLPSGFQTPLGEGAQRLSGGQRQRLDIARALVRQAPILILDEPTSALDAEAEQAFRTALMELRQQTNLTIIVIAHRLSTIADADQIVVLRQGRLEAVGSHHNLLKTDNWYSRIYTAQQTASAGERALADVI